MLKLNTDRQEILEEDINGDSDRVDEDSLCNSGHSLEESVIGITTAYNRVLAYVLTNN